MKNYTLKTYRTSFDLFIDDDRYYESVEPLDCADWTADELVNNFIERNPKIQTQLTADEFADLQLQLAIFYGQYSK